MSFARMAAIGLAAWIYAALVLCCGPADAGGPYRAFKLGFWSGGAYTDDRTGAFTHCSAGVAYDSGINVFVLVTGDYRWWLGFINPDWALTPNARMPVALRFGGGPRLAMQGTVPSREVVLVPLPANSRTIDSFRRSSQLNLTVEGRSFHFKLGGTPAVMAGLEGCVRTSLALAAHASPVAPATSATAASTAPETAAAAGAAASPAADAPKTAALVATPPAAPPETPSTAPTAPEPAAPEPAAPEKAASAPAAPAAPPPAGTASLAAIAGKTRAPPVVSPPSTAALPSAAPRAAVEPAAKEPAAAAPAAKEPGAVSAALEPPPPAAAPPASGFSPRLPAPQLSAVGPAPPATGVELEELGLAKDFFETAQLPNAHLAIADKPAALASFSAVWRSDNAAGAVKIIPPGPDVTGIGIASNLIAVDPQMCKGNFASARSSARLDGNVVFSAVLSCTEAAEQRTAQYFITSRHDGGFVVFAVVGSNPAGTSAVADQQRIELFQKAAVQAAGTHG